MLVRSCLSARNKLLENLATFAENESFLKVYIRIRPQVELLDGVRCVPSAERPCPGKLGYYIGGHTGSQTRKKSFSCAIGKREKHDHVATQGKLYNNNSERLHRFDLPPSL